MKMSSFYRNITFGVMTKNLKFLFTIFTTRFFRQFLITPGEIIRKKRKTNLQNTENIRFVIHIVAK